MDNFNNYVPEGTNDNPNYNGELFTETSYGDYQPSDNSAYANYNELSYGEQSYGQQSQLQRKK